MNPSRSRMLTALIAWVAGAATAVTVGLLALSSIDFGLSSRSTGQPFGDLTRQDPPTATSEATPSGTTYSPSPAGSPWPTGSSSPAAEPSDIERTITFAGGTVIARCTAGGAYLVSWSPAQGYHSENVRRGPAQSASVKFEGRTGEHIVTVTCVDGVPQGSVRSENR